MRSNALAAEAIGTFALVFAGCGAVIAHVTGSAAGLPIGGFGVALAFGFAVMVMAYSIGRISGCHLNPAVTLGLAVGKRFDWKDVPTYWVAQMVGATAAAGALMLSFGNVANLGATLPADGLSMTGLVAAEAIATAIFVFVIMAVTDRRNTNPAMAPLAIGMALGLGLLVLGPFTGGSMNPARSFGPALVAGAWDSFAVYVLATLGGGAIGSIVYGLLSPTGDTDSEGTGAPSGTDA